MDPAEARHVLGEELARYRHRSYAELVELMRSPAAYTVTGASGVIYQLEVQATWDDRPGGNLRVMGAIDDGGWRAFIPLCDDFVVAPDGTFVGE